MERSEYEDISTECLDEFCCLGDMTGAGDGVEATTTEKKIQVAGKSIVHYKRALPPQSGRVVSSLC